MAIPLPPNTQRVIPYLHYADARAAIDFLSRAFGFELRSAMEAGGAVMHAELGVGDCVVYLGSPGGVKAADKRAAGAGSVLVYVEDVDAHYARAKGAGAEIAREPQDEFYGDRTYAARDPQGQQWYFHSHIRDVSEAELRASLAQMAAATPAPRASAKPPRARKPAKLVAPKKKASTRKASKPRPARRKPKARRR